MTRLNYNWHNNKPQRINNHIYHNDPKFSDRYAWANSADADQTACHSVCIVWTHYSMVEPHSSNFRVITTNFLGDRIFRVSEYLEIYGIHLVSFIVLQLILFELEHNKTTNNKVTCMPSEDSYKTGHPGVILELSDREKLSSIQGEVLVQMLDFPICSIHFNFSLG